VLWPYILNFLLRSNSADEQRPLVGALRLGGGPRAYASVRHTDAPNSRFVADDRGRFRWLTDRRITRIGWPSPVAAWRVLPMLIGYARVSKFEPSWRFAQLFNSVCCDAVSCASRFALCGGPADVTSEKATRRPGSKAFVPRSGVEDRPSYHEVGKFDHF
jgi:hypothetical protein